MRTLYRRGTHRSVVPLELRAGMVEGHWTPVAARQAMWVVAHLTPGEGEGLFAELGNMRPSKSSLDRLPKRVSARWEAGREGFDALLRAHVAMPAQAVTVAVSLDGVMTPMKAGERLRTRARQRADGKRTKGPAGYREVGCGTLSFYDAEGARLTTGRSRQQGLDVGEGDETARELGRSLGVGWIVAGGFQRVGNQLRITARVVEVESGAVSRTVKVDGGLDELFALQDRIVAELGEGDETARVEASSCSRWGSRRGWRPGSRPARASARREGPRRRRLVHPRGGLAPVGQTAGLRRPRRYQPVSLQRA